MEKAKNTKELGDQGEEIVAGYLEKQGYRILERNFVTPFGEIDIVAKKGRSISIVEVKTRLVGVKESVFRPEDNITLKKQHKLIKLGHFYIAFHKEFSGSPWEIDVAAVEMQENAGPQIRFLRQAVTE